MANLISKTYTELYHNRPRFVKHTTKHFGVFFGSSAVHLQNANAKFHKVG